jgi:ketosteroid isomerase-like protein
MHPNEALIHSFYKAFQNKDYRTMQESYHPEATFSDPVFQNLTSAEARAMWQMLVTSAKDLEITYGNVKADAHQGECHWEARYTFSGTGRKVHNVISSRLQFRDGKILRHADEFNFWRWSRMALGGPGWLMGWTPYLLNAVRQKVRGRLDNFMKKNGSITTEQPSIH